jgi:CRP-like cAMP-binding protein
MLLKSPLFPQDLDSQSLYRGKRLHFYNQGEGIPIPGDGVWQVYRGLVQLSTFHDSGEEVLIGWVAPSTLFGLNVTHLSTYNAKALSEVYLRWFSLKEIETSPQLAQVLLIQLNRRMRQTEILLAIAGLRRVEDRLRQLLDLLRQDIGQATDEGIRLPVRLTHQTLANAIGTTRVTVTRLLGDFQRQGEVSIDRHRHIILKGS